jgi:hypothetical protein
MSYYGLPPDAETSILPEDIAGALGYVPVNKIGDTLQGPLFLSRDPAEDMEAATKKYVDSKGLGIGAGSITVATFSGNGSNKVFTLPTAAPGPSAVEVHIDSAYQLKSSYTVDGTQLTFGEAPPAGTDNIEIQIRTVLPLGSGDAATTVYTPSDGTANTTVEYVLDSRLTRLVRKFSGDGSTTTFSLPVPAFGNAVDVHIDSLYQLKSSYTVTNNLLTFTEAPPAGTDNVEVVLDAIAPLGSTDASLISYTAVDGSNVASVKDALDQRNTVGVYRYTGNGSNTTFVLPFAIPNANMMHVHINSVYQEKSGYTLSGTNLTFSSAPDNGASIEVTVTYALPIGVSDAATTRYLSDDGLIVSNVKDALDTFKKERGTATVARYSGTGSATTFNLPVAVANPTSLDVYISGAYQQKTTYTAYGTTLTFLSAPVAGTNNIEVVIRKELPLTTVDATGVNYTPAGNVTQTTVKAELDKRASQYVAMFIGDGTTTVYTLPVSVSGTSVVDIHFDGVYQRKDSYTALGTTLTFSEAPLSGITIEVVIKYEIPFSAADAATTVYNPNDGTAPTNVKTILDQIRADRNTVNLDNFVGDGTKVAFTLAKTPVGVMVSDVFINASYQQKATYSIVGKTLTFSEAPPAGSIIEVLSRSTAAIGVTDAALVTNGTETVADSLNALQLADYTALRNYVGPRKVACVGLNGMAGDFVRDDTDTTSVDNAGTIIVSSNGKRWKRAFNGTLNVTWFGAVGDGVKDDTAAIQAAINYACSSSVRRVFLPAGVYLITSSLKIPSTGAGLVFEGASSSTTYLRSLSGSFDLLKVAAAYTRIIGIQFRPGGDQICMRIYAAHCTWEHNRFLAATNNVGTAVLYADVDPDTSASVAGAYTHTARDNVIGVAGFAFAIGISDGTTLGLQACKFICNQILSNSPIKLTTGGANTYMGNLLQSSTGGGVGNGVDLGANIVAEKLFGNYFEGFAVGVLLRSLSNSYQAAYVIGNHFDACTSELTSLGTSNYVFETANGARFSKNWKDDFSSNTLRSFNGPSGGTTMILTLDDANKAVKINREYTSLNNLSFTANGQTQTPTQKTMVITGSGAARTGCILGTTGVQDGEEIRLLGVTWPVTLINTNVRFAGGAASAQFGNTAGYVQAMTLVFRSADSTWYEISRVTY